MNIEQFGYIGFNSTNPDAFTPYATDILGMQATSTDTGRQAFRIDSHEQRIIIEPAQVDGAAYCGWQLASTDALRTAADDVQATGVTVTDATPEELEVRKVAAMVHFTDPAGHRVELYTDPARTNAPFTSGRGLPGFVAEDLGLGHCVLTTRDLAKTKDFYVDVLGFKISDYMVDSPFSAFFLHINGRHHSLALADGTFFNVPNLMHHFMLEVDDENEVGRSWDFVQGKNVPVAMNIGRHTNDRMFSFYVTSPVGVHTEFGAGGLLVDDATWQIQELPGPDIWGHRH